MSDRSSRPRAATPAAGLTDGEQRPVRPRTGGVAPRREPSERFRGGMAFRRMIHGAEHVDRAWEQARGSEHRAALEEFITECVWGMIWSRQGLPTKTRSLITIALLIATQQPRDLILHMRSAVLRNECSMDELREVVLHTAAYCGVPAAVEAFAATDQLEAEMRRAAPGGFDPRRRKDGRTK